MIRVPEGVGPDRKVRVQMSNSPEELEVPPGSQAGEVVTCELPRVEPLCSEDQKRILYEAILMVRLRWTKPQAWNAENDQDDAHEQLLERLRKDSGLYTTDEERKRRKVEAYRTLRGRRMGLVFSSIEETTAEEEHEELAGEEVLG